ncbi:MAG: phosphoribulokinase [Rhodospirillales bacterium]|nr:phosphoribulokinase [Rhodospirillales bacterium]MBL6942430.1 phosphoribulokinase [Rhodospirillales bacterium]
MSSKHPIVALARPSGAATPVVMDSFAHVFRRLKINAACVEGESFHRYSRTKMIEELEKAVSEGNPHFSHFGPEANLFAELEELFRCYGENGTGQRRQYLHSQSAVDKAGLAGLKPGDFTPWEALPENSDMLFYQGLHGCVVTEDSDVAQYVDLKLGIVPIINMEWIQKIHRDINQRGYSEQAVIDTILRRMHEYVHYLIPQFQRTDINFQLVPTVDTSDPFFATEVPTVDECVIVIRFSDPDKFDIDFPFLLSKIDNSWMSRRNSIVVPGGKMGLAMELILTQILAQLMDAR